MKAAIEKIKAFFHHTKTDRRALYVFLFASLGLVLLDLGSKWLVQSFATPFSPIQVIPNFFYITLSYNTGVAFGLGAGTSWGRVLNILISLFMSIAIFLYLWRKYPDMTIIAKITGILLFSGAVGNLIDRAFYWENTTGFDGVIDFLQFYLGGGPEKDQSGINPFATFNFADSYLTVGIVLLLIILVVDLIKGEAKKGKEEGTAIAASAVKEAEKPDVALEPGQEAKKEDGKEKD